MYKYIVYGLPIKVGSVAKESVQRRCAVQGDSRDAASIVEICALCGCEVADRRAHSTGIVTGRSRIDKGTAVLLGRSLHLNRMPSREEFARIHIDDVSILVTKSFEPQIVSV